MPRTALGCFAAALLSTASFVLGADPTFLRRSTAEVSAASDDLTANATRVTYRPLFGIGDTQVRYLKSIARYGELRVEAGANSAIVSYPAEAHIYYILSGAGEVTCDDTRVSVKPNDFLHLPPGSQHAVSAVSGSSEPIRLLVMGFQIPKNGTGPPPSRKLMVANLAHVPKQTLAGDGPTTKFQLLMGTIESKRDKLAAASTMVSLFVMDFAPGGTNIPHHHETEEDIYFVLHGTGEMVAGGGADGNEGRYPTKHGYAWFLRLNTTVGFYSGATQGSDPDQVVAVRSTLPFPASICRP